MVEKGTKVKDDSSGDIVATRDALETDEGANPRVIEIVDFASRSIAWSPVRGDFYTPTPIGSADGLDLDLLLSTLYPPAILIGDKSVVGLQAWHTQNDGSVIVTPVFYNGFIPYIGEAKQTQIGSYAFTGDPSSQGTGYSVSSIYYSPILSWDCLGAERVSFHVTELSASNGVYLLAGVI